MEPQSPAPGWQRFTIVPPDECSECLRAYCAAYKSRRAIGQRRQEAAWCRSNDPLARIGRIRDPVLWLGPGNGLLVHDLSDQQRVRRAIRYVANSDPFIFATS